jgi:sulfotransferase
VDFIDHLADFDRFGRADMLFAKDKTIGAPLISLHVRSYQSFAEQFI